MAAKKHGGEDGEDEEGDDEDGEKDEGEDEDDEDHDDKDDNKHEVEDEEQTGSIRKRTRTKLCCWCCR